jgi:hypothetical protein
MRTEPILKLDNEENIRSLFCDPISGSVLVGTSQGRILLVNQLSSNAYFAGNRTIYASRKNCQGEDSEIAHVNVQYGLHDRVVELTDEMVITRWKSIRGLSSVEGYTKVSGVFTTPVLWVGEDFGWWDNMTWNQTVGENSRVVIAIRVAGSEDDLLKSLWITNEEITSGAKTWNLDRFSAMGGYAQMKIVLESTIESENPTISNLVLPYYARHASYFFTTKISMTKGTSIRGGLLTASVSVPRNTEIKWGVSSGSANWNDVIPIIPDKLFTLPEDFGDRLKVGAKLFVYDNERYPTIDEFSIAFDSDIDNLINK